MKIRMQFRLLACALAFAPLFVGQPVEMDAQPEMVWQGEVTGTTFLYVKGKRLQVERKVEGKVENKGIAPVGNQRFHIEDPLPQMRQDVRLHVLEGRGYVHIVEQPHVGNEYTLTVEIEDWQHGSSPYSLALYWDAGGIFDRPEERGRSQVKWSGRVEEEVVVSCAVDHCTSEAARGAPVMREHFKFTRPMPAQALDMRLDHFDGRGEVRLVEAPNERNGYTARVQIRDPQAGVGEYAFTLSWKPGSGTALAAQPSQTGLVWSGRVEGTVRVTVHGGGAISEAVTGQPVTAERALFERPLPARSDLMPVLTKRQGRGAVRIVDYPSNRNGYQLVFEIRDTGAGSDQYEVEVSW